jgi:uncharacterized iron-regulated membrane protein
MRKIARWHVWLGWLAAVPLLLWLISGLFMTLRPIEQVRGEHLRAAAKPISADALIIPANLGQVNKLALTEQLGQPVWVIAHPDKSVVRFSARTGNELGAVSGPEARMLAAVAVAGEAAPASIQRFSADQAPIELRKARPSWQVTFGDGTHVYVDAESGEVLALRTRYWRIYDFMWGLHIMDPVGRENSSHALLWFAGVPAVAVSIFGAILLFRKRKTVRNQ